MTVRSGNRTFRAYGAESRPNHDGQRDQLSEPGIHPGHNGVINMTGSHSAAVTRWVRWQDWVAGVLGLYLILAPLWTTTTASATSTMLIIGILLLISSAWSLAFPKSMTAEYAHILLGVLLFIAPWPMGYAAFGGAAWTSWVVGVLTVLAGLAALPSAHGRTSRATN